MWARSRRARRGRPIPRAGTVSAVGATPATRARAAPGLDLPPLVEEEEERMSEMEDAPAPVAMEVE
jgi:hypothetical protein